MLSMAKLIWLFSEVENIQYSAKMIVSDCAAKTRNMMTVKGDLNAPKYLPARTRRGER